MTAALANGMHAAVALDGNTRTPLSLRILGLAYPRLQVGYARVGDVDRAIVTAGKHRTEQKS
jgi:hypothetical protein